MSGKSEDLVLPGPFDRQITETRDSQAVRQTPIHRGFDEFWRQESQRYCHVDLADAACGAGRDGLGCGIGILDQLLEPTASLRNRSDHRRFRFRANGPSVLPGWVGLMRPRQTAFRGIRSEIKSAVLPGYTVFSEADAKK